MMSPREQCNLWVDFWTAECAVARATHDTERLMRAEEARQIALQSAFTAGDSS